MLWLLACASEGTGKVHAAPTGGDPTATDTDDSDDADDTGPTDTTDTTPTDPWVACATEGAARARCGVEGAGWAAGTPDAVTTGTTLTLDLAAAHSGSDADGSMNGGSFRFGTWTSPVLTPGIDFDGLVPWWNATTPAGTWIRVETQVQVSGSWSAWYQLGIWASGDDAVDRHSYEDSGDRYGDVWTDTVFLDGSADAARLRLTLYTTGSASPTVSRAGYAAADTDAGPGPGPQGAAWGIALDVPTRSQMEFDAGEAWCSPTSISMVLAYWATQTGNAALDVTVPEAAEGTWDEVYGGNGNWPFNVAYAASLGLSGEVGWFDSLDDLEPWIAAGVPVVLSAAWERGDIDGAAIDSTNGHLLVLRGFDGDGDALVNDPAAHDDGHVALTYDRAQLEAAWLGGSTGVTYLLWDGERPVP